MSQKRAGSTFHQVDRSDKGSQSNLHQAFKSICYNQGPTLEAEEQGQEQGHQETVHNKQLQDHRA